jgi:hypothetical protein
MDPMRTCTILLAAIALCAAGCGLSNDQACTDSANARCAKIDECSSNGVAAGYGTLAVCIKRTHDNCVASLAAPGTGNSAQAVEDCAKALPAETCQDFEQGNPVAACKQVLGLKVDDASCGFNGQCQTGFCGVMTGNLCGTCAEVPVAGDSCAAVPACGSDMTCTPQLLCEDVVASGGTCDGLNQVCAPNYQCVIAAGATTGTCQEAATASGDACDPNKQTAPGCDGRKGLYCDSSSGHCAAITYVEAGSSCAGAGIACTSGASCFSTVCVALAIEGEACDIDEGPGCMAPDRCVVNLGSSGVCAAPDGDLCRY